MNGNSNHGRQRSITVAAPFDLARTAAPVWWAKGRWPNIDWRESTLVWVGWEAGVPIWRSVRQESETSLSIGGSGIVDLDETWAGRVIGTNARMPRFQAEPLRTLAATHSGMRPWAAGSLFEGVVASIVGQSISVAAAAVTERRLYALFNPRIMVGGRSYWTPPRADQLATADANLLRTSGVTMKRAEALTEVGRLFASHVLTEPDIVGFDRGFGVKKLLSVSGIGSWTVRSAFLWGIGEPDVHPSGDVALLRAVKRHHPEVTSLKELDQVAEGWTPYRSWAARLFWLDLLGFANENPTVA